MKYILSLTIVFLCISCGNKKELQLPEIDNAEITEITDVSAAYLFYDETQPDSVELNRKNLISTTNWLVNVDKRLTLKQAIPHIKFLQDKKKSSSHKNEKAKNYFTCHDLSETNLGFLEFTNIIYKFGEKIPTTKIDSLTTFDKNYRFEKLENIKGLLHHTTIPVYLYLINNNTIYGNHNAGKGRLILFEKNNVKQYLNSIITSISPLQLEITTNFDGDLSFQEYISYKKFIESLKDDRIIFSNDEFIFN